MEIASGVAAPASRNDPCPCGSGRRYKICHGAIGAPGASVTAARSKYRAPASEWGNLDEPTRDALGVLMERALAFQQGDRAEEAAQSYREVLAIAPGTHDALHMLGVIELARDDPDEAERLILAALALRPGYPAITHNVALARDAQIARSRALPEQLCEHALPLLADLALGGPAVPVVSAWSAQASSQLHLIGCSSDLSGDAWILARLAEILASARPEVWVTDTTIRAEVGGVRAEAIDGTAGHVPRGGIHLFVGTQLGDLDWLRWAEADRVIVLYTGGPPSQILDGLRGIACDGRRRVELWCFTRALAARFGTSALVAPIPIALVPQLAAPSRATLPLGEWTVEARPPFVVGVVGQDGIALADARNPGFLTKLALHAGRLHVYDPGRLRYELGANPSVRFLPRVPGGELAFLRSLGCYVHRALPWWDDAAGRILATALACGLPVLCPRGSAFAESIAHGVDGLLYGDDAEATAFVKDLARAPSWGDALGAAARARAREEGAPAILARRYTELLYAEAASTAPPPANSTIHPVQEVA
ncbi:MAG: SEC-C metal-binding domain-containing protein [Casimicrobiaceae bacterium]